MKKITWSPKKAHAISRSPYLKHRVGVNEFFCRLKAFERNNPGHRLVEWKSEGWLCKSTANLVYPDGWGIWETPKGRTSFFLEYDRGTESLDRLRSKLYEYGGLLAATERIHLPVFVFESYKRELSARKALDKGFGANYATTALYPDTRPHEAIWWQPFSDRLRRLDELEY